MFFAPSLATRGRVGEGAVPPEIADMRNAKLQHRARALRNESTDAERQVWTHLRGKQLAGHRFRRQLPIAGFIADFACLEAKIIVELDGGQHAQNVGYDGRRDRLIEAQQG